MSPARQRALRAVRSFVTPLLPDDYLELVNPLWTTRELRGRIERVHRETDQAVSIVIRPGHEWPGHRAGQYVRIGIEIDGVLHWRAYSLTSEPGRTDGCIAITPKLVDAGRVSPHLVRGARPGDIVRLGGVEGTFTLPDPPPERLLMLSAGSGITPIMSMLRALARADALGDVVHVHCARVREDIIFEAELRALEASHAGYALERRLTGASGRLAPPDLDRACPDWRERDALASGPGALLDALAAHYEAEGVAHRLRVERFQPRLLGAAGAGGVVRFGRTGAEVPTRAGTPILVAAEGAGLRLDHGCRMGICRTCVGRVTSGRVRDLRTGEVLAPEGQMIRICVTAPEGPVEIDL